MEGRKFPAPDDYLKNALPCPQVAGSECEADELLHKFVMPCNMTTGLESTSRGYAQDSCLEGGARHVGAVAGFSGCKAVMQKCTGWQKLDGALVHTLCEGQDVCMAEAAKVPSSMPDCMRVLENGTELCNIERAKEVWQHAVETICEPFGAQDLPRW